MSKMKSRFVRFPSLAMLMLTLAGASGGVEGAENPQSPGAATAAASIPPAITSPTDSSVAIPQPAITKEDLDTFFDGLIRYGLAHGDGAGGVIVVVKDGRILFAKGYGYANVAQRKPVVADETLFRIASITKLFTWTAVMQLVEQGKLDLDRDVNEYLDFKILPAFGKPITLRNLMTHTTGFEETFAGGEVKTYERLGSLREYVLKHQPARIFAPGEYVAYSNYGADLAGYIVERVSGEPYADYVTNHILKPLKMDHSTLSQPLPPALLKNLAEGYLTASDKKPLPFQILGTVAAGGLETTGTDIAAFMMAQLRDGTYDGTQILKPETAALMHSPQSTMAPGMNGFDLGFYQENRNGLRIIGHAGDLAGYHSELDLLLDKDIGVFTSFNAAGVKWDVETLRVGLFRAFLDHYFPYSPPEQKTVSDPKRDAARVSGWYQGSRRMETVLHWLFVLQQSHVTSLPDGTIEVSALMDYSGTPKRWREVGPLTYRDERSQARLKFVADPDGNIRYWISDDQIPVVVNLRTHGLAQFSLIKTLAIGFVVVLVSTLLVWGGGAIVRKRFYATLVLTPQQSRLRLASRLGVVTLLLLVSACFAATLALNASTEVFTRWLVGVYVLGVLSILGALAILLWASLRCWRGPGGWLVKTGECLLAAAALYGLWLIFGLGLASFNLHY
jgi:CubicO group peptidase (beta-lactamase class C family)